MNRKKYYRIELKSMKDIAKEAAVLAALSNGNTHIPLASIVAGAEMECIKYPSLNEKISVHLIGDCMTIDLGIQNLLVIQEVEICELDVPTLSCYEAKELLDPDKQELLN